MLIVFRTKSMNIKDLEIILIVMVLYYVFLVINRIIKERIC